eukprot:1566751-Alexandrium_andersonii.AAC.1
MLGPGDSYSHLKRQRRRESDATYIQANPKHIDKVLEALGLTGCKGATTPSTADYPGSREGSEQLATADVKVYRSCVMGL